LPRTADRSFQGGERRADLEAGVETKANPDSDQSLDQPLNPTLGREDDMQCDKPQYILSIPLSVFSQNTTSFDFGSQRSFDWTLHLDCLDMAAQ